MFIPDKK